MQNSEPNSQKVSEKRRKVRKSKKLNIVKITIFGICGIILIYVIAAILSGVNGGLRTTTALNGAITEEFRCDGYVFRDQTLINAPFDGYIECMVDEGERVKKDQTVAYIYNEKPNIETITKIKSLHKALRSESLVEDAKTYNSSTSSHATATFSDAVRNMSDTAKKGDITLIVEAKEKLNGILGGNYNDEIISKNGKKAEQIKSEIEQLNKEAGNGQEITAPAGGVFSARIDGMEDKLSYEKVNNVNPAYISELDSVTPSVSKNAEAGKPMCKIINNYNWCFATLTDEKNTEGLSEGTTVEMGFFDLTNTTIKGTVKHISETDSGKRVITIATNKYVDGIYSQSKISADIVTISSEGIKLPISAIHVKDSNTGVYVVRLDVARFVPVKIKYKNDEWVIVSPAEPITSGGAKLQIYDEVIVDKKNLEDGKRVR